MTWTGGSSHIHPMVRLSNVAVTLPFSILNVPVAELSLIDTILHLPPPPPPPPPHPMFKSATLPPPSQNHSPSSKLQSGQAFAWPRPWFPSSPIRHPLEYTQ